MVALFALLIGVYGVVSAQSYGQGYEATYVASAEGLVRTGQPKLVAESPLYDAALGGTPRPESGEIYPGPQVGWGGPVTALSVTLPAMALDSLRSGVSGVESSTLGRKAAGALFPKLLTALSGVLVFAAALMLFGSRRRAILLALTFGLATIALPYSKIGMEPPLMFWTVAMLTSGVATRNSEKTWPWMALGLSAAMAAATRMPVAPLLVAPFALVPLIDFLRRRPPRAQAWIRAAAVAAPYLASLILSILYNEARCGTAICTPDIEGTDLRVQLDAASVLEGSYGLLLSPGKSFFVTTPVALLGLLGLIRAWQAERMLALAVLAASVVAVAAFSPLSFWSDETYGPRYLVYLVPAFVLLVGYGLGWAPGQRPLFRSALVRRSVVVALVGAGALIQLLAVVPERGSAPCAAVHDLVGPEAFSQDLCRFVPPLSDVPMNARMTFAVVQNVVGHASDIDYEPFLGPPGGEKPVRFALSANRPELQAPYFFWARNTTSRDLAVLGGCIVLALGGAAVILRRAKIPG